MLKARVLDIQTKFKKDLLVQKLKEHCDNHVRDYEKASEVYKRDVTDAIAKLTSVSKKSTPDDLTQIRTTFRALESITVPVDQVEMYEAYISMFQSSAEDEITISMVDANCIINDSWDWAVLAKSTNAMYSSRF